jgi:pentose-5-phosphate-3-epimerase
LNGCQAKVFVEEVKSVGKLDGTRRFTPAEEIDDASWEYLDCVILMAVEAGLQGQQFLHRHLIR